MQGAGYSGKGITEKTNKPPGNSKMNNSRNTQKQRGRDQAMTQAGTEGWEAASQSWHQDKSDQQGKRHCLCRRNHRIYIEPEIKRTVTLSKGSVISGDVAEIKANLYFTLEA